MSLKTTRQQPKKLLFDFENTFYEGDTWDMHSIDKFKDGCKKMEVRYFHFENIENKYIRNEFKAFTVELLKTRAISTTASYVKTITALNGFINEKYPNIYSILDICSEKLYDEYNFWLNQNNYVTIRKTGEKILQDMSSKKYKSDTMYTIVLRKFYKFILDEVYPDTEREYDKDKWDIRNLGIPVTISESRPRYTVNFEKIKQTDFKSVCKQYIYHRLKGKAITTALEDLKALNCFSEYIEKNHKNIAFKDINREIMEDYFRYARTTKISTLTLNKRIGTLKTFFDTIQLLMIKDIPLKTLIVESDYRRKEKALPKFFSDNEIKEINKHMDELPIQIARMLFVIENVGLRISDLCALKVDCLKQNNNGEYLLSYYQPKTKKYNVIPINEIVGVTIEKAIEESKTNYGDDCKYVFSKNNYSPIANDTFVNHLNKMSANNKLMDDTGKPLRIKSHTFRGTVATKYANLGIDINVIRMMLGQSSLGVLKHYVTIHNISMLDAMKSITDEDDKLIANIGNVEDVITDTAENKEVIPLPNGCCTKSIASGKCAHANACYTCRMFRPSSKYLLLYKNQLNEVENNIQIAQVNGFERLLEINIELKQNLIKIINTIEKDGK
ncbi:tyrosine-type recombinase/integrase [Clostridium perfringens]|uniref:tyrosine-type recombinase/integrase n=1 Tax=Clostridium perfringens TaxID=1502 RepID=UPI002AC4109B|nr:tyrosine-type recombinase/integrase [Clostridium perfringens]MDZ5017861.1 tyrosine-type recombinase/integrase [Clostridium perfringens]